MWASVSPPYSVADSFPEPTVQLRCLTIWHGNTSIHTTAWLWKQVGCVLKGNLTIAFYFLLTKLLLLFFKIFFE